VTFPINRILWVRFSNAMSEVVKSELRCGGFRLMGKKQISISFEVCLLKYLMPLPNKQRPCYNFINKHCNEAIW